MANRIEIGFRQGIRDALGEKIKKRIIEHLRIHVDSVTTIEVYTIDGDLTPGDLEAAARGPLSDPVIQEYAIDRGLARGFDWLIEVGFRPGVTDNVGKTAAEAIALLTGKPVRVYTSRQYVDQRHPRPVRPRSPHAGGCGTDRLRTSRQRPHPAL